MHASSLYLRWRLCVLLNRDVSWWLQWNEENGPDDFLIQLFKRQRGLSSPFRLGELLEDARVENVPAKLSKRCQPKVFKPLCPGALRREVLETLHSNKIANLSSASLNRGGKQMAENPPAPTRLASHPIFLITERPFIPRCSEIVIKWGRKWKCLLFIPLV